MLFKSICRNAGLLAALVATSAAANPKLLKVAPQAAPVDISASYRITLNGFNLGDLKFSSQVHNGTYSAESDVNISALLGAFKWHGVTRTAGLVTATGPQPQAYNFDFGGTSRSGSVRMAFTGPEITAITLKPQSPAAPDTVPLERQHLKGALDPLSAIISLIRPTSDNPCARRLAIFDGKQRFDLQLSLRRQEPLQSANGGAPQMLMVCKVKYVPVAGYRPTAETQTMAASNGIEIAFRRASEAGLAVPHRVVIPTMAGDAMLEAERVTIEAGGRGQIALVE